MAISSLIIHFDEKHLRELEESFETIEGVEALERKKNQYAILIEAPSTDELAAKTEEINSCSFVNNVQIISHFFEDEIKNKN